MVITVVVVLWLVMLVVDGDAVWWLVMKLSQVVGGDVVWCLVMLSGGW